MSGSLTRGRARSDLRRLAALASPVVLALALSTCRDRAPTAPGHVRPAERVTVAASRDTARVIVGTWFQLSAMVENPEGHELPNKRHTVWVSTRPGVASVDSTGRVVGVDTGRALVIAVHKKTADTVGVHVVPVPVARVVVTPASATIEVGEPVTLSAATLDSIGGTLTGRTVAWTSSDGLRAWVSAGGIVTGSAPGVAIVAAESEGQRDSATVTVLVPWVLDVTTRTMAVGERLQLHALREATVLEGATWETSDSAIATVSATGEVRAVAPGTATITARWGWSGGAPRTATVTVRAPVASVSVQPASDSVEVGESSQLTAIMRDQSGNELSGLTAAWSSSDSSVATVSPNGLVTAVKRGSATISASVEGRTGSALITVPTPWIIAGGPSTIGIGDRWQYQLVRGSINCPCLEATWTTDNSAVLALSPFPGGRAEVFARDFGTATLTAVSGTITRSLQITVTRQAVNGIYIKPTSVSALPDGQTVQFEVTLVDRHGQVLTDRAVTWSSSDPSVATITQGGLLTGVRSGLTYVVATSEGVRPQGVPVYVVSRDDAVATLTLTPASATTIALDWPRPARFHVTLRNAAGMIVSGQRDLSARSLDPSIATVGTSGDSVVFASGQQPGTARIVATVEGHADTSLVTVTPAPVASVEIQLMLNGNAAFATGCHEAYSHGVAIAYAKDQWNNYLDRPISWRGTGFVRVTPYVESIPYPPFYRVTNKADVFLLGTGTDSVVATSEGVTGRVAITSRPCTNQTTVSPTSVSLAPGQETQLVSSTTVTDYNSGRPIVVPPSSPMVTWTSSNTAVATVTGDGRVRAIAAGQATISAYGSVRLDTYYATSQGQATVTVTSPVP